MIKNILCERAIPHTLYKVNSGSQGFFVEHNVNVKITFEYKILIFETEFTDWSLLSICIAVSVCKRDIILSQIPVCQCSHRHWLRFVSLVSRDISVLQKVFIRIVR
jgi:hypothetical protein